MFRNVIGGCVVLAAVSMLLPVSSASATLLYYEGFDYAPGLVSAAGSDWHEAFSSLDVQTFNAGSLSYGSLTTSGNHLYNNKPAGQNAYTVNDTSVTANDVFSVAGTYYLTIIGQVQNDVAGAEGMGVVSIDAVPVPPFTAPHIQMGFQADGAGNLTPNLELNYANQIFGSPVALSNGEFLIALRVINDGGAGADQVDLVLNPDLNLGEPDWNSPTLSVTNKDITSSAAASSEVTFSNAHAWDEIRVATTWSEAAPLIPEPASLALMGLGGLLMLRRR